jgi:hypothetical protein
MSSSFNGFNEFYEDDDEDDDSLKLKLKMFTKKKQRLSIFQNENIIIDNELSSSSSTLSTTQSEILKRFNLTQQKKTPNIRFDVTLKPNLSIRGDRIKASKIEHHHTLNSGNCYNTSVTTTTITSDENKKKDDNDDKTAYFSLPVHVRSRNRDSQIPVTRHNSDLSRVHSPFTYIETYSIKRRSSLSPKSLFVNKKARRPNQKIIYYILIYIFLNRRL